MSVLLVWRGWALVQHISLREPAEFFRVLRVLKRWVWLSMGLKLGVLFIAYGMSTVRGEPWIALSLGWGLVLLLGEFALMFWKLYPIERFHRGLELSLGDYVRVRISFVFEQVAPLVIGCMGLLTLGYTLKGGWHTEGALGVLIAGAMGMTTVGLAVLFYRGRWVLPVRSLSLTTSLQSEVQRLARSIGLYGVEVVVLDGRRARMANAFALPGGRIAISDYLMANLSEREVLAVLAHEVAHLAQRRRLVRLWVYLLGTAVGLTVGLAPLAERLPNWIGVLLMGILFFALNLPMVWLRHRHEREADAFAISEYGADSLRSALCKIYALNRCDPLESSDSVHPSLRQRLKWIENHSTLGGCIRYN